MRQRLAPPIDESGLASSVAVRCAARALRRATLVREIGRRLIAKLVADTTARGERLLVVRIADGDALGPAWRAPWRRAARFDDVLPAAAWLDSTPVFAAALQAGRSLYRPLGHLTDVGT